MYKPSVASSFSFIKSKSLQSFLKVSPSPKGINNFSQVQSYCPRHQKNAQVFKGFVQKHGQIKDKIKKSGQNTEIVIEGITKMFELNKKYENNNHDTEKNNIALWKRRKNEKTQDSQCTNRDSRDFQPRITKIKPNYRNSKQDENNFDYNVKRLIKMSFGVEQYDKQKQQQKKEKMAKHSHQSFQRPITSNLNSREQFEKNNIYNQSFEKINDIKIKPKTAIVGKRFISKQQLKLKNQLSRPIFGPKFMQSNKANRLQRQIHQLIYFAQNKKGLRFPNSSLMKQLDKQIKDIVLDNRYFKTNPVTRPKTRDFLIQKPQNDFSVPIDLLKTLQTQKTSLHKQIIKKPITSKRITSCGIRSRQYKSFRL